MFKKRAISVLIALPIIVAVVWKGNPWVMLLAAAWAILSTNEFYKLVSQSRGISPVGFFGMLWVALIIFNANYEWVPFEAIMAAAVMIPLVILLWRKGKEQAFASWAWTVGGILYIGLLLSYYVSLRNLENGMGWVFLALLCTFASDISAYLVGGAIGKHKLAPYVSPNKTWEGCAGGLIGSVILSVAVVLVFGLPIDIFQAVLLGVLVSVIGQLGDLVKSLFKRNMAVKDSGQALPGHGGFLDRMDSVAFAGVAVYYFVVYILQAV